MLVLFAGCAHPGPLDFSKAVGPELGAALAFMRQDVVRARCAVILESFALRRLISVEIVQPGSGAYTVNALLEDKEGRVWILQNCFLHGVDSLHLTLLDGGAPAPFDLALLLDQVGRASSGRVEAGGEMTDRAYVLLNAIEGTRKREHIIDFTLLYPGQCSPPTDVHPATQVARQVLELCAKWEDVYCSVR